MALIDKVFSFIGSKWFVLILGIGMMIAIPFTYHNFIVIYKAGQMGQFKFYTAAFFINIISIGMCAYKFMSLHHKPKPAAQEEW
jgi:hypothetical protein